MFLLQFFVSSEVVLVIAFGFGFFFFVISLSLCLHHFLPIFLMPIGQYHSQYHGNLNAHRSMRDYRNSPWMNVPSCMVPPSNVPCVNSYKHSWRNNLKLSWGPEPPQYAPPASPYYASTPQPPQPPQLTSSVRQAIPNLSKLVDNFIEEQRAVTV